VPFTQESARLKSGLVKTALATSKVRLFKSSFAPTVNSTVAEFVAAECDFDGYPATGIAVTAMLGPVNDPLGGSNILSPVCLFLWTLDTAGVTNMVGGFFHTTAAGALYAYQVYTNPVPMAAAGDSIAQVVTYNDGQNGV
jgi:hypothetical protein